MIRDTLLLLMLAMPLKHLQVTSAYGSRIHPITRQQRFHAGIDLRAHQDTVYSVIDGETVIGYDPLLGLYIKLTNGPFCMIYGHLSRLLVGAGSVAAAMPLAISGSTGRTTGEHLHFAVQVNGRYINPLAFLSLASKIIH